MKRLFWAIFFVLTLTTPAANAQGAVIHLPAILKGDDNMPMAILEISDGETTVNLLAGKNTGFHLTSWRPKIIQPKGGGVYQDSSIAPGRSLVFAVDGTAAEVFNLKVNGGDQDQLIHESQELLRLLLKARAYGTTSWQSEPVWIKARAACETNARYARIINFTIDELDNPYAAPFFNAAQVAAMDNITLGLERGHWLGLPPGQGECAEVSSEYEWGYGNDWVEVLGPGATSVYSLLQLSSGRILLGGDGEIWRSDNNGNTWAALTLLPTSVVYSLLQTTTGRILAGDNGEIWRSDDNGATWVSATALPVGYVRSLIQTTTGRILAGEDGQIWYSDDNGATWAALTTSPIGTVYSLLQTTTGRILAGEFGLIWYSDDDGATWGIINAGPAVPIYSLYQSTTGRIFMGSSTQMFYSDDNGATMILADIALVGATYTFVQTTTGRIYAGDYGQTWYSDDDGITWAVAVTTTGAEIVYALIETTTGRILDGGEAGVLAYDPTATDVGRGDTCDDEAFIANRQNVANLTHIFIDDGGVFSANLFPMAAFPASLLPAAPAVNDAVYFGVNILIDNSGPFGGLVFDLSSIITFTNSYTITWEIWTGAAWVALTVQDGTDPMSGGAFRTLGVSSVHWAQPATWATTAVNGVSGLWVRARVSALAGTMTAPAQQNRNIYAPVLPYVDIAADQVLGDIPALAQIKAHNRSDKDGPGGSGADLYANRLLVGLRSYDRGPTFQAFLNVSDEQNPFGVTVTLGTNTTFGTDIIAPTGRSATYNPAAVETMATRATIALGPSIARDFYGTYHAFLRGQRSAGAATDLTVRLQVVTGSGGVSFTTETKQFQSTTAFEFIDFGQVTIPAGGSLLLPTELGDTTELRIQASAASGVPNLVLYDLILIPVDEWSIDAVDVANEADSEVGQSGGFAKLLDLDSVTNPKAPVRAIVRRVGSELITSIYNPIAAGEVVLQANAHQRLWFLAARTSATGASYYWLGKPEISHSVQVFKNSRYLGLRGAA